jgi:hypothetical protein
MSEGGFRKATYANCVPRTQHVEEATREAPVEEKKQLANATGGFGMGNRGLR